MFLKNYTSDVPVHITIGRIEQILLKCQVSGIMKEYGPGGKVLALTFSVRFSEDKTVAVRLPAKEEECLVALWKEYAAGCRTTTDGRVVSSYKKKTRDSFRGQAEKTAWKLMQDWVEVQMSMIQLNQADIREVFMAYIWDGKQTFFDRLKSQNFRAMLPESTDQAA